MSHLLPVRPNLMSYEIMDYLFYRVRQFNLAGEIETSFINLLPKQQHFSTALGTTVLYNIFINLKLNKSQEIVIIIINFNPMFYLKLLLLF